ncbi:MAG: rod shape-determining protein MreC [Ignavibacteriales bacterium]
MLTRAFKNKIFWLVIITIASLVALAYTSKSRASISFYEKAISYVYTPIQKGFNYVAKNVQDTRGYFNDAKVLTDENKNLKVKIVQLEEQNRKLAGLEYENQRLRDILDVKGKYENYSMITCRIIAKESGNWFNIFTIDKGTNDGINYNMAVVTPKGVVGQVVSAGPSSSKVMSIIDSGSSVSGRLTKTRDLVILRGDLKLKENGLIKMLYIPVGVQIADGDIVETSGIGGIYPPEILIGKVKKIDNEQPKAVRYAVIEPTVDFKKLEEVIVLKPK